MPTRLPSALLLSLVLTISACGASMKNPDIKQNPHPTKRYEITVTVDGAPRPFDSVQAAAGYDIANTRCVPLTSGSGATIAPEKSVPIALTRTADNVYKGMVYVDLLQDEDYYGLGVCHWKMTSVSADLNIRRLTMSPFLALDDVLTQKPVTRYFSYRSYASSLSERVDSGHASRADFGDEASQTFSITLAAKEDSP
ncbi:hypothetical protein ACFCQI_14090 [Rhodanobacter sp. FW102-FHT14D06]|uniref:Lipoprotein n=2 Tax=unclassified Rhodanobacter TaxID=2621553 RepID=A0AB74V085_9GAMM